MKSSATTYLWCYQEVPADPVSKSSGDGALEVRLPSEMQRRSDTEELIEVGDAVTFAGREEGSDILADLPEAFAMPRCPTHPTAPSLMRELHVDC